MLQLASKHVIHPSWSAASRVPSTRERIFAKAVSRAVERSSPKGEKPQSSVVPSSSSGMNSDASSTRSLTSWGVSTFGLIGSITRQIRAVAGANSREQSGERAVYPPRLRAACKSCRRLSRKGKVIILSNQHQRCASSRDPLLGRYESQYVFVPARRTVQEHG